MKLNELFCVLFLMLLGALASHNSRSTDCAIFITGAALILSRREENKP